jgi:hypothetical protein
MALADTLHTFDAQGANGLTSLSTAAQQQLAGVPTSALKEYARVLIWRLYDMDRDTVIASIDVWFFHKKITVDTLRPLIERWLGPHP